MLHFRKFGPPQAEHLWKSQDIWWIYLGNVIVVRKSAPKNTGNSDHDKNRVTRSVFLSILPGSGVRNLVLAMSVQQSRIAAERRFTKSSRIGVRTRLLKWLLPCCDNYEFRHSTFGLSMLQTWATQYEHHRDPCSPQPDGVIRDRSAGLGSALVQHL